MSEEKIFSALICDACRVWTKYGSEYSKDFMYVHQLCGGRRVKTVYDQRVFADYTALEDMTVVGRALVFERILSRLIGHVEFLRESGKTYAESCGQHQFESNVNRCRICGQPYDHPLHTIKGSDDEHH